MVYRFVFHLPFLWLCASAQQLQFIVEEDGQNVPLVGAIVRYATLAGPQAGVEQIALTDSIGLVSFTGDYSVQFVLSAYGYLPVQDTLPPGELRTYLVQADPQVLGPIVVTPLYGEQYAHQAVQKIQVIQRDRIEAQGAVNLADLLSNQPNVQLQRDNILGTGLSLQGMPGQHVKILIDGVPVIGRLNGNVDLSQINLNTVQRVEIIEGPMSVIYGTDALGGVINLITQVPTADSSHTDGRLRGYYESVGQYNLDGGLTTQQGPWQLSASAGRNFFAGWRPSGWGDNRSHQWKPKEQYFGNLSVTRRFKDLNLSANTQVFDETLYNLGRVVVTPQFARATDELFYTRRASGGVVLDGYVAENRHLNVVANYNYYRRRRETLIKNMVTLDESPSPDPTTQDTSRFDLYTLRAVYSQRVPQARLNYQFGMDVNTEVGTGKRLLDERQQIGDYAAFVTLQYKASTRLLLSPALRMAYNTRYAASPIPSLNLRYSLSDRTTLRASYAAGFRAPTLKELNFFFVDQNHNIRGNEKLEAERSHNLSLQLVHDWRIRKGLLTLEASGFYNQVKNWIELAQVDPTTSLYTYVNVRDYYTHGANLGVTLQRGNASVQLGTNVTARYNFVQAANTPDYYYAPGVQLNPSYHFRQIGLRVSAFYKYNGRVLSVVLLEQSGREEIQQNFVDAYHTLDLTLTKSLWKNKLQIVSGVKNALDVTQVNANQTGGVHSSGSTAVPISYGRSLFLSAQISL
ncbi:MAG: TonB-dependent receptor [Bacteroidetes bacterium]|jgi:outer membrane receptor for ferrienterochelin and colicins|nr:TonB-dependent receptor [Bacteroidota bacterium]